MEQPDNSPDETKSTEKFCNHFAGALLVPKNALISKAGSELRPQWSEDELDKLAESFKVSQEVILRRLVILSLAPSQFYTAKRKEWEAKLRGEQRPRRGGRRNPPRDCIQQNGVPFVSLVLEAHREGRITYNDIGDYLGIRLKHVPKIEEVIRGSV